MRVHKPEQWCECEHACHFDQGPDGAHTNRARPAHPYGEAPEGSPLTPIKTDFGTFKVCKVCAEDCLAIYTKPEA
jgi:hypothetical protein